MNDCKCWKCGNVFKMGASGVHTENGYECDKCNNVVRLPNGEFYNASSPYELCHRDRNGKSGVRPGDTVYVHPNRGTK